MSGSEGFPDDETPDEHSEGSDYNVDAEDCDDEAMLFRRNPNFQMPGGDGEASQEDDYDWTNAIPEEWRDIDFTHIHKWLEEAKANNPIDLDLSGWWGDIEYHTLFEKQKLAVALVKSYIQEGSDRGQLLMHLMGTAGTGKTHTVKAICKMATEVWEGQAGENFMLAAPTGTAAFLIKGRTLHRALKLPTVDVTKMDDLSGPTKATLEQLWKHIRLLIIDEQSMVGRRMLGQINRRLKQIKGSSKPFGGVHVILVGDNGQLPPVKDKPKFDMSTDSTTILPDDATASLAYWDFNTVVRHDVAARQSETDEFYSLLQRIREGEIQVSNWEFLKQRNLQDLPTEERAQFKDAIRLMSTKKSVEEFNLDRVQRCPGRVARLKAEHNKPEAQAKKADDFQGLKTELHIAVGAQVMLKANKWQEAGLVNGQIGFVRAIVYDRGIKPPSLPRAIIVEFPNYIGPGWNDLPHHVALPAERVDHPKQAMHRTQFPIDLAYAMTIHKSQGITIGDGQPIKKVVIDIGDREQSAGLTFVALSRAKDIGCLAFEPMPSLQRLQTISTLKQLKFRKKHDQDLIVVAMEVAQNNLHLVVNDPMFSIPL